MNDICPLGTARPNSRAGRPDKQVTSPAMQTRCPDVLISLKTGQQLVRKCQATMFFSLYACNRNI